MDTVFSTAQAAPGERLDFWREMVRRHFVPLRIEPLGSRDFNGAVRLRAIVELDVALIRADPMMVARGTRHIECSAQDEYFVGLQLSGGAVAEQAGRRATLRPGDFALFDSARPYRIAFGGAGRFDHLIIRIPRELLDRRCSNISRTTAIAIRPGSGPGGLVTPVLRRLTGMADPPAGVVDPILDLLTHSLALTAGLSAAPAPRGTRMLGELKRYTLGHLADTDLSPASAAAACSISVRQLHRLFADDRTTFGAFLKDARLRNCRRDLADPRLARVSIAAIARGHGFHNASVFTRAFTARYGVGPRSFRRQAAEHPRTVVI